MTEVIEQYQERLQEVAEEAGVKTFLNVKADGYTLNVSSFGGGKVGICIGNRNENTNVAVSVIIDTSGARHAASAIRGGQGFAVQSGIDVLSGVGVKVEEARFNNYLLMIAEGLETGQMRIPEPEVENVATAFEDAAEHADNSEKVDPKTLQEAVKEVTRDFSERELAERVAKAVADGKMAVN